jgi:hypothetical protein
MEKTAPTRKQVEALLALEAEATPGDWKQLSHGDIWCMDDLDNPNAPMFTPNTNYRRWGRDFTSEQREIDANLVAAARNLIRPLAEAYLAGLDAADRTRVEELEDVREPLMDVLVHLIGAHSLLSRSPKKAAPSNRMFDQMLVDYECSIERGRAAITELDRRIAAIKERKS